MNAFSIVWKIGDIDEDLSDGMTSKEVKYHYEKGHLVAFGDAIFYRNIADAAEIPGWILASMPNHAPVNPMIFIVNSSPNMHLQPLNSYPLLTAEPPQPPPDTANTEQWPLMGAAAAASPPPQPLEATPEAAPGPGAGIGFPLAAPTQMEPIPPTLPVGDPSKIRRGNARAFVQHLNNQRLVVVYNGFINVPPSLPFTPELQWLISTEYFQQLALNPQFSSPQYVWVHVLEANTMQFHWEAHMIPPPGMSFPSVGNAAGVFSAPDTQSAQSIPNIPSHVHEQIRFYLSQHHVVVYQGTIFCPHPVTQDMYLNLLALAHNAASQFFQNNPGGVANYLLVSVGGVEGITGFAFAPIQEPMVQVAGLPPGNIAPAAAGPNIAPAATGRGHAGQSGWQEQKPKKAKKKRNNKPAASAPEPATQIGEMALPTVGQQYNPQAVHPTNFVFNTINNIHLTTTSYTLIVVPPDKTPEQGDPDEGRGNAPDESGSRGRQQRGRRALPQSDKNSPEKGGDTAVSQHSGYSRFYFIGLPLTALAMIPIVVAGAHYLLFGDSRRPQLATLPKKSMKPAEEANPVSRSSQASAAPSPLATLGRLSQQEQLLNYFTDRPMKELINELFDLDEVVLRPTIHRYRFQKMEFHETQEFRKLTDSYRREDFTRENHMLNFIPFGKILRFSELPLHEKKHLLETMAPSIKSVYQQLSYEEQEESLMAPETSAPSEFRILDAFQWLMLLCGMPDQPTAALHCYEKAGNLLKNELWHIKPSFRALHDSYITMRAPTRVKNWIMIPSWPVTGKKSMVSIPELIPVLQTGHSFTFLHPRRQQKDGLRLPLSHLGITRMEKLKVLTPSLRWRQTQHWDFTQDGFNYQAGAVSQAVDEHHNHIAVVDQNSLVAPSSALSETSLNKRWRVDCDQLGIEGSKLCHDLSDNIPTAYAVHQLLSRYPDLEIPVYQRVTQDQDGNGRFERVPRETARVIKYSGEKVSLGFRKLSRFDTLPRHYIKQLIRVYAMADRYYRREAGSIEQMVKTLRICGYIPFLDAAKHCYLNFYNPDRVVPGSKDDYALKYAKAETPAPEPEREGFFVRYLPLFIYFIDPDSESLTCSLLPVAQLINNGKPGHHLFFDSSRPAQVEFPYDPEASLDEHRFSAMTPVGMLAWIELTGDNISDDGSRVVIPQGSQTGTFMTEFFRNGTVELMSFYKGRKIPEL
ncbi:hypothetical protein [Endozoicomonas arenosclerae]|uniref:hypothetical protein n=1 Tax=Endozoicomonas arenosclerae TaxID=1633495 RepID=UPI0012947268|nr:hypothetical protein [Endozoicomonas arenosclerae]